MRANSQIKLSAPVRWVMWTNPFVPNNFDFAYQVPPDGILPLISSDALMGPARAIRRWPSKRRSPLCPAPFTAAGPADYRVQRGLPAVQRLRQRALRRLRPRPGPPHARNCLRLGQARTDSDHCDGHLRGAVTRKALTYG